MTLKKIVILTLLLILYLECKTQNAILLREEIFLSDVKNEFADLEIYSIILLNKNYLYLTTNKGLYYSDGNSIRPVSTTYTGKNKDYIGAIKLTDSSVLCLPYWSSAVKISNHSKFNHTSIPKFERSNYKITGAYKFNDSIIHMLCSDYFDLGSLFEYNTNENKIRLKKKKYPYTNFFIDFLFQNSTFASKEMFIKKYGSRLLQMNERDFSILDEKHLNIDGQIFEKNHTNPKLLIDLGNYNIEGRVLGFLYLADTAFYFSIVGKDKGLYFASPRGIQCIYNSDDVSSVKLTEQNKLVFSTIHRGLIKHNLNNPDVKKIELPGSLRISKIQYYEKEDLAFVSDKNANIYDLNLDKLTMNTMVKNRNTSTSKIIFIPNDPSCFSDGHFLYPFAKTSCLEERKLGLKLNYILKGKDSYYNFGNNFLWKIAKPTFAQDFDIIKSESYINHAILFENNSILLASDNGIWILKNDKLETYNINSDIDKEVILNLNIDSQYIYITGQNKITMFNKNTKSTTQFTSISSTEPIVSIPFKGDILCIDERGYTKYTTKGNVKDQFEIDNYSQNNKCLGGFIRRDDLYIYTPQVIYKIPLNKLNNPILSNIINIRSCEYAKNTILFPSDPLHFTYKSNTELQIIIDQFYLPTSTLKLQLYEKSKDILKTYTIEGNAFKLNNINPGMYEANFLLNNRIIKKIEFAISLPWYNKIWFIFTMALIFLGIFSYIIFRFLQLRNYKKIEKLSQLNYVLQLETQSKLNQLKPHFIFNALMPLQHYLITSDKEKGQSYLKKLSSMLRQLMNLTRNELNSIHDEINFINLYLETQQVEKSSQFSYDVKYSLSNNELVSLYLSSLMIQPLIENAIVHGISTTKNGQIEVQLELDQKAEYLKVKISDNGPGFSLNDINPNSTNALNIIIERIQILKKIHQNTNYTLLKTENYFTQIITLPLTRKS